MKKGSINHENQNHDAFNEMDICDLDRSKICDSCGKCLEINNDEYRKVLIDDIYESKEYEEEDDLENNLVISESKEDFIFQDDYKYLDPCEDEDLNVEFIEDIEGLRDLLEDKNNQVLEEVTPGLFVFKNIKRELH